MRNVRKLLAAFLTVALLIGALSVTSFAATTGTGTMDDPIVCETLQDLPGTYTVEAGGQLWFRAPVGGEILSVTDANGDAEFMHPMTWFPQGVEMDYTGLPAGEIDDICIMNNNTAAAVEVELIIGKLGGGEGGGDTEIGTEENPLPVEYSTSFFAYLMNEPLEEGDTDGIWYTMVAAKTGILYVDVNCYDEVPFSVDVYAGIYQGVASEGNPIITYRVQEGETITIHKYVDPDLYGNVAAASQFYVSASLVEGTEEDPVSIKSSEIKVPVASGETIWLMDTSRNANFCGKGLVVSGWSEAVALATITVNGVAYTDVDGDGTIELNVPGDAMSRPAISITNNHEWPIAFTFTAVEAAAEDEPAEVPGDLDGDGAVTNADVIALMWNVLFPDENPISGDGDFNNDGAVTNDDVILLMWHVLFPEENPLS